MLDPVRVSLPNSYETTCERDYAAALDLTILEDEPVFAHGRLRGVTRKGGRRVKPRTAVKKATPAKKATAPAKKAAGA